MASPAHPPWVIRFGAFELDAACGTLRKGGVLVKMHPQPFRVLLLLSEYPGQIVTRDQIQRCLWGDNTFVDFEGGINFCVRQVRAALGDDADKPKYIETLPRRGYRFIASVGNYRPGERRIADKHSAPSGRVYEWLQRPRGDWFLCSACRSRGREEPTDFERFAGVATCRCHCVSSRSRRRGRQLCLASMGIARTPAKFRRLASHQAHQQWQGRRCGHFSRWQLRRLFATRPEWRGNLGPSR